MLFRVGFCDLKEKSDGTLMPGSLKNKVKVYMQLIVFTALLPTYFFFLAWVFGHTQGYGW